MNHSVEYYEPGQMGGFPTVSTLLSGSVGVTAQRDKYYTLYDTREVSPLTILRSAAAHRERWRIEAFIKQIYFTVHRASLHAFMPELFAICDETDTPIAVIGLRHISTEPTFLEQYLDISVEHCVSEIADRVVSRARIAEVGNLASLSVRAASQLIVFMAYHLAASGIEYGVCTGTSAVRAVLRRMGIEFTVIRKAEPDCLGEDQAHWGHYYQCNPFVLAIDVAQAAPLLRRYYRYVPAV